MRDRTSYTSGSVPWDVENKFGESKMQDTEIISVILATAHAYLNAGVRNLKIAHDVNGNIAVNKFQKTQSTRRRRRHVHPEDPDHSNGQDRQPTAKRTATLADSPNDT